MYFLDRILIPLFYFCINYYKNKYFGRYINSYLFDDKFNNFVKLIKPFMKFLTNL